jgi:HPt (histidine-containing phosphotransfer) domain-containing protein
VIFKELAENLGLEEEEFLELVELFIETSASDIDRLESAIDEENAQEVAETAHSIKGASGNLGFREAQEAAKEIEEKARNERLEGITESVQVLKKKLDLIAELVRG